MLPESIGRAGRERGGRCDESALEIYCTIQYKIEEEQSLVPKERGGGFEGISSRW